MRVDHVIAVTALTLSLQPGPRLEQQAATLRLERTITGDQLGIGYVGAITVDARGRIYALETSPGATSVVVFDSTGKSVTRFGRSGQGPGEFERVSHTLGWLGDTLLVFDGRALRLTGFDRDGKPSIVRDWPGQMPQPDRFVGARGQIFGVYSGIVSAGATRPIQVAQSVERSRTMGVMRFSRDGSATLIPAIADTIPGVVAMQCAVVRGDMLPFVELPFKNPRPLVAVTPAGEIVRAHLDKYQIDILDATSGRTLRTIRRDVAARPLTSADLARTVAGALLLDFEREGGGKLVDSNKGRPCPIYEMLPKVGPPLRSVTSDDSGRLWVEVLHATQPGRLALQIYDAAGRTIVETIMPQRDMRVAPYVRGDRLYMVTVDTLGVQSIAIHRLVP